MAELNLWLDSYYNVYAYFDSRRYIEGRISEYFFYTNSAEMKFKEHYAGDMIAIAARI